MDNDNSTLQEQIDVAMREDQPVLPPQPVLDVDLPGGYIDNDGVTHTTAVVREMTGADEEALDALFKAGAKRNRFDRLDTLITRCVTSIGTHKEIDQEVAHRLLQGDRDFLAMQIRRVSFGDEITGTVICPACGESNDVEVNLTDDVEIKRLEEGAKRTFTVPLRNGSAEVRLINGADQHAMGVDNALTLAEMNTILLSRVVVTTNGEETAEYPGGPEACVQAMGSADRRSILEFLVENQPGPRLGEVTVPCASCTQAMPAPVDLDSLLRW